jgi:hypothetical protein
MSPTSGVGLNCTPFRPEHTVFFILNFDDLLGEYKADYFGRIDDHVGSSHSTGVKFVFYNQKTAFHRSLSMRHAEVVNEPN